MFDDVPLN